MGLGLWAVISSTGTRIDRSWVLVLVLAVDAVSLLVGNRSRSSLLLRSFALAASLSRLSHTTKHQHKLSHTLACDMARPQEINEAFLLDTASTPATAMQLQQLAEQLRGGAKPGVAAGAAGAAAAATGSPSVPGVVSIGGVPATQQGFALPAGGAGGTTMSAPRAIPQLQGSLPPLTGQGTRPVAPSPTVPLRQLQQQPLQPQQQQQQQQQPQQPQRVSPLASRGTCHRHHRHHRRRVADGPPDDVAETLRAFIDHVSSSPEALQMQGQLFLEFTSLNKTALVRDATPTPTHLQAI